MWYFYLYLSQRYELMVFVNPVGIGLALEVVLMLYASFVPRAEQLRGISDFNGTQIPTILNTSDIVGSNGQVVCPAVFPKTLYLTTSTRRSVFWIVGMKMQCRILRVKTATGHCYHIQQLSQTRNSYAKIFSAASSGTTNCRVPRQGALVMDDYRKYSNYFGTLEQWHMKLGIIH